MQCVVQQAYNYNYNRRPITYEIDQRKMISLLTYFHAKQIHEKQIAHAPRNDTHKWFIRPQSTRSGPGVTHETRDNAKRLTQPSHMILAPKRAKITCFLHFLKQPVDGFQFKYRVTQP